MSGARDQSKLLFVHGAGGFHEDAPLAEGLAESVGAHLVMPRLPDDDMTPGGWAAPIRTILAELTPDDVVVGHSFGASILVKVLAERPWAVSGAVLLAMPNWGSAGWDVGEYVLDRPEPHVPLTLHHCADDDVVPLRHLELNREDLPNADLHVHDEGGHQFNGLAASLLR